MSAYLQAAAEYALILALVFIAAFLQSAHFDFKRSDTRFHVGSVNIHI